MSATIDGMDKISALRRAYEYWQEVTTDHEEEEAVNGMVRAIRAVLHDGAESDRSPSALMMAQPVAAATPEGRDRLHLYHHRFPDGERISDVPDDPGSTTTSLGEFVRASEVTRLLENMTNDRDTWKAEEGQRMQQLDDERRQRAAVESLVKTPAEGVWRWVGDSLDHPESLSCPVVMSAETLRGFQSDRVELERVKLELAQAYARGNAPANTYRRRAEEAETALASEQRAHAATKEELLRVLLWIVAK